MPKPIRMSGLRKVLGNAHFEVARGTREDNISYCTKDDPDAVEFGDRHAGGQGTRNDLLVLRDALKRKASDVDLLDDDETAPQFFKYQGGLKAAREAYDVPAPREDIKVALFYGAPGTGKSHLAREIFPDAYWKDNTKWWPGYTGQSSIVWDEFGGWSCAPSEFNKVFDKYPHYVEVKGGTAPLRADQFIIISNFTPGQWWDPEKTRVDLRSVTRRIHRYCLFEQIGQEPREFPDYTAFGNCVRGAQQ